MTQAASERDEHSEAINYAELAEKYPSWVWAVYLRCRFLLSCARIINDTWMMVSERERVNKKGLPVVRVY